MKRCSSHRTGQRYIVVAFCWLLIATAMLIMASSRVLSAELIMFRQDGCAWCMVWQREIGPIYPKTPEGSFAPLRQVDISQSSSTVGLAQPVTATPTFVLFENDREIGRITGYPGASFFWELLSEILEGSTFVTGAGPTLPQQLTRADAPHTRVP